MAVGFILGYKNIIRTYSICFVGFLGAVGDIDDGYIRVVGDSNGCVVGVIVSERICFVVGGFKILQIFLLQDLQVLLGNGLQEL